jgi:PHD/YefM family antitoxin component YafN of YafNO toxin-antitoxin module
MSATVQYLTDKKGKKTAVVLPIEDYEKLREDLDDLAVIAERREEETIPHAEFKRSLKRHGVSR